MSDSVAFERGRQSPPAESGGAAPRIRRTLGRWRALTPSGPLPWKAPRYEVALLALVSVVALTTINPVSPQDQARICLAQALIHGNLSNDPCLSTSFDRSAHGGHLYSDKAPGVSLLEVPALVVARPGPNPLLWGNDDVRLWVIRVLTVGLGFLATAFLVGRVSEGLAPGFGGLALVGYALGTLAAPLAASSFEHDISGAFAFGAFLAAWRRRPGLAGLLAGFEMLVDYEAALVLAVLAVYVALSGRRPLGRYLLGVAPSVVVLGAYDWAAFGAPWHLSYGYIADVFTQKQNQGLFGIGVPHLFGFVDVLAGSGGLLVISPVLLLAGYGLWLLAREHRPEALVCAVITVAYAVIDMGYFQPYGGPPLGPRFVVPALPFLALGLAPALRARPFLGVVATGVSVVALTALTLVWDSTRQVTSTIWDALWHVPSQLGAAPYVHDLTPNVLDRLGLSSPQAALVVAACAAAAFALALAAGPWAALRRRAPRRLPRRARVLAIAAGLAVVAGADALAVFAYPYGDRTYASGLPQLVTSIQGSTPVALPGDEVNFIVTVSNRSPAKLTGVFLTLTFPGGMTLLGLPVYPTGPHCTGGATYVCSLVEIAPESSMAVRLGVKITQGGTLALGAATSAGGIPGARPASFTVVVGQ